MSGGLILFREGGLSRPPDPQDRMCDTAGCDWLGHKVWLCLRSMPTAAPPVTDPAPEPPVDPNTPPTTDETPDEELPSLEEAYATLEERNRRILHIVETLVHPLLGEGETLDLDTELRWMHEVDTPPETEGGPPGKKIDWRPSPALAAVLVQLTPSAEPEAAPEPEPEPAPPAPKVRLPYRPPTAERAAPEPEKKVSEMTAAERAEHYQAQLAEASANGGYLQIAN